MKKILFFFCVLQSFTIFAQDADIEYNFGPGPGFGSGVAHMVTQPDGKIIVNGSGYRNAVSNLLIRLNPDGSIDPTFNYTHDIHFTIKCLALQTDGKLLIGGNDYNNKTWVMRLNGDGTKDTSFQIEVVIQKISFVNFITLQPDGKILIANDISSTGLNSKYLIRLNADGSVDTTFNIGTGFDGYPEAVAVQSDGKIIVGGYFSTFRGIKENGIIRLNTDGTKDTSFITGTGFPGGGVHSIVIQNDGKIIIGGGFNSYQGVAQRYLIRLNADGSKDTSFTTPTDFKNINGQNVSHICLQPDGKLIVNFYTYNGNFYSSGDDTVYRFNTDGSFDASFPRAFFRNVANLLTGNMDADVLAIVLLNNGKILIGGDFTYCRNIIDKNIVCLNADGSRDSSFNKDTGVDAAVFCSAVQTDGKTLIGGYFDNFQGVTQKKLIRLNLDGSKDTSFNFDFEFNDEVQSLLLQPDGKILVRGKFTYFGKIGRNSLVRLNPDGSRDTSFTAEFGSTVGAMALQPDGKIIVQALVSNYPNGELNKIFRLNPNGTPDISFKPGSVDFNNFVNSIVVQPDGKILVGGNFTAFAGITQNHLIRLNPDGSKDTSFDIGILYDLAINVGNITLQPDGKILVSGLFSPTAGGFKSFLVRLNSDGSKDPSFNQGIGFDNVRTGYGIGISSLILQTDGKILVGGEFDTFQGIAQRRLTRLNTDGTVDTSFNTGIGFGAPVYSLSLLADGKINVGGTFSSYRGISSSSYLIRLKGAYVQPTINATTLQSNLTCPDSSTGSASIVSVYNGKTPYTYLWSNGATTPTITGLEAGNYFCTITDADGVTITKNFIIITYSDFQRPSISGLQNVTVNTNVGCTAANVALGTPTTSDNCSAVMVTNDAPAAFPIGNTTVIWTAKDANNNISTYTQTVSVIDSTLPTITAPAKVTVNAGANCRATGVALGVPVTADNCTVASITNNAPTSFYLGETTVIWTVKDKNNNIAKATQIVKVIDSAPPTITAPAAVIVAAGENCSAKGVALGTPVTTDNCSIYPATNDAPATFPLGETVVNWTVRDTSNNTATATQTVTVKGPDVTITNNAGMLSVAETAGVYKWFTCNNETFTVIQSEKNQVFTPNKLDAYAVEVSKNGCTRTSTCFDITVLGTENFDIHNSYKLFPNPANDLITIEMNSLDNAKLNVFDLTGRYIFSRELKTASTTLNISNLPAGIYLFRISNDSQTETQRVIKN